MASDGHPLVAVLPVLGEDHALLVLGPRPAGDRRVKMVEPTFPALLATAFPQPILRQQVADLHPAASAQSFHETSQGFILLAVENDTSGANGRRIRIYIR